MTHVARSDNTFPRATRHAFTGLAFVKNKSPFLGVDEGLLSTVAISKKRDSYNDDYDVTNERIDQSNVREISIIFEI